jgi:hypothetical protein
VNWRYHPLMSNFAIADQPGLCLIVALSGTDSTGTSRGLSNVNVTISDTTNAYIADMGPNSGGYPQFSVVPRQNVPGGTPLSATTTIALTVTANDPVLGGALPPLSLTCDLQVGAPPPPHSINLNVQSSSYVTPATLPTDPGTATISNIT